jgi:hypothetical protein
MWSPNPTECYSGSIVVFKSGGDRSPIQTAQLRLDKHIKHSEFPEVFSWRFPDGREETFEWKWSTHIGLTKVRDENEEMLGTGKVLQEACRQNCRRGLYAGAANTNCSVFSL